MTEGKAAKRKEEKSVSEKKKGKEPVKQKVSAGKKGERRYVTGTATERGRAVENRKVEKRKYNKTIDTEKRSVVLKEREKQIREMRFEDMTFVELAMAKKAGRRPTPVPLARYLEKEPGERIVDIRYGGYQLVAKADCLLHILSDEALNASVEAVKVGSMKTTVVLRSGENKEKDAGNEPESNGKDDPVENGDRNAEKEGKTDAEQNGEMTGEGDRDGRLDRGTAEAAGDDPERVGRGCGVGGEGAADEHGRRDGD